MSRQSDELGNLSGYPASLRRERVSTLCGQFLDGKMFSTSTDVHKKTFLSEMLFVEQSIEDQHSRSAGQYLEECRRRGPRQVCQYQFRKNDIVWICKSCQQDDTCVQCNECFEAADHKGHEVFFYHSQAGGCCDCGDASSWRMEGCCTRHGIVLEDPLVYVPDGVRGVGTEMMKTIVSRLVRFCAGYKEAYSVETSSARHLIADTSAWHLVLHNDDINSFDHVIDTLVNIGIGTQECRQIAMTVHKEGWKLIRSGCFSELKEDALLMQAASLQVALLPDKLYLEREAILITLSWMLELARVNDGFCRLVSGAFPIDDLISLFRVDNYLCKDIVLTLHNLYLALMADIAFKSEIARAYSMAISDIARNYSIGLGPQESSAFSLSVQFLNRPVIVNELVHKYGYLTSLCESIACMLDLPQADFMHEVLNSRRYNPLFGDLKIMFSIAGVSRIFCSTELAKWLNLLSKFQYMHDQYREIRSHIEFEGREWINAFNLYLGMTSMFDYLVSWFEHPSSTISETSTFSDSTVTVLLPSAHDVLVSIKNAVVTWQAHKWLSENYMLHDCYCFPNSVLQLGEYPRNLSFHILLHRFLANSIRECCKYHMHIESINRFRDNILSDYESTKHLPDLPLLAMSWASQIKAGIWRRNGQSMMAQFVNYAEAPLCRSYRDLDILFIQFFYSCFTPEKVVNHVFRRFGIYDYAVDQESDGASVGFESAFMPKMVEESLLVLIQLTSEIPIPAVDIALSDTRIAFLLRREIVHRLVSGPKTYSQLQECLSLVPDFDKCETSLFDSILDDVSHSRDLSALDAPQHCLKAELWAEYDPSFLHITSSAHQEAFELRPKLSEPTPLVGKLLPCHPFFTTIRLNILSDCLLHNFILSLVNSVAARRCNTIEKYAKYRDQRISCSESEYFRVLHLITLIVHVLIGLVKSSSLDEGESQQTQWLRKCISDFFAKDQDLSTCDKESGRGCNFDGLFDRLIDIYKSYSTSEESNHKMWHKWIIDRCTELLPCCRQISFLKLSVTEGDKKALLEARKNDARERAMQAIQSSAKSFACSIQSETKEGAKDEEEVEKERPICIICQEESDSMLGYLGFSQMSTIMTKYLCDFHLVDTQVDHERPDITKDIYVQTCGHVMHLKCFDGYFATVVHKSEQQQELILDTKRGQFQCPLCKKLNNMVVPLITDINTTVEYPTCSPICKNIPCWSHRSKKSTGPSQPLTSAVAPEAEYAAVSFASLLKCFIPGSTSTPTSTPTPTPATDRTVATMRGTGSDSSVDEFCRRFLLQLLEPLDGGKKMSNTLEVMHKLFVAFSAVAFQSAIYSSKQGESANMDDFVTISRLISALALCIDHFQFSEVFAASISNAFVGLSPINFVCDTLSVSKEELLAVGNSSLLLSSLLEKPLLESFVMSIALDSQTWNGNIVTSYQNAVDAFRWFSIAKLSQLVVGEFFIKTEIPDTSHTKKLKRIDPQDAPPSDDSTDKDDFPPNLLIFIRKYAKTVLMRFQSKETIDGCIERLPVASIVSKWQDFISAAFVIMNAAFPYAAVGFNKKTTFSSYAEFSSSLSHIFGIPDIESQDFLHIIDQVSQSWFKCEISSLEKDVYIENVALSCTTDRFCSVKDLRLLRLPDSYTKLHGDILTMSSYEYPAICLTCGAILNADGQGLCTNHGIYCSPEAGVYFLVQDCIILLLFRKKAAYFPSPYVDSYGEKHRHFKGRPLFLDQRRMDIINKLRTDHDIPREIIKQRSSSARVIISGHY